MTETSDGTSSGTVPPGGPTTDTRPPEQPAGVNTDHLKDFRPLRRSATDRKLAGVAGGLGQHLNIDPVIIRVLFVVLAFFGGAGLLLYGAAWMLVPDEATGRATFRVSDNARNAVLIGLSVIAALLVVSHSWGNFWFPWPLAVIALIVVAILMSRDRGDDTTPAATAATTADVDTDATAPLHTSASTPPYTAVPAAASQRRRKRGPFLFGFTLALLAIGLGGLGVYESAGNTVVDGAYPALALGIVGVMLVVGAFFGRPGGLILLGLVSIVALVGASIGEPGYKGERDQHFAPATAADVQASYRVPAGRIELDLTKVSDLTALDGRTIHLDANAGEIVVIVPRGLTTDVHAAIRYGGAIDLPGFNQGGWGTSLDRTVNVAAPQGRLTLDMNLSFGHIEVRNR